MVRERMILLAGPSGSGKTTIAKHLISRFPRLRFSVSATTRPLRGQEVNGEDYYFLSEQEFRSKLSHNELIEHQEVYPGRFYGTLRQEMDRIWNSDMLPVLDVDVKGAVNIKTNIYPEALAIFVHPVSIEVLGDRLKRRATETESDHYVRIQKAAEELEYAPQFDVVIINDDLNKAFYEAEGVVGKYVESCGL